MCAASVHQSHTSSKIKDNDSLFVYKLFQRGATIWRLLVNRFEWHPIFELAVLVLYCCQLVFNCSTGFHDNDIIPFLGPLHAIFPKSTTCKMLFRHIYQYFPNSIKCLWKLKVANVWKIFLDTFMKWKQRSLVVVFFNNPIWGFCINSILCVIT